MGISSKGKGSRGCCVLLTTLRSLAPWSTEALTVSVDIVSGGDVKYQSKYLLDGKLRTNRHEAHGEERGQIARNLERLLVRAGGGGVFSILAH